MSVTHEKLAIAKIAFLTAPQPATAAMFLSVLREAEEIALISPCDFNEGLAEIEAYLWKGGSVIHDEPHEAKN